MFSRLFRCLSTTIMIFLCAVSIYAQSSATTGTIFGTIKDEQDAIIVGAKITVQQLETNLIRTTQQNNDGLFRFVQLPPGRYRVTAEAAGFSSVVQNITLSIGTIPLLRFVLPVGSNEAVIEVTPTIQNELIKTEKSSVINQQSISSLPINRRNFLDFTLTTANVIQDLAPLQGTEANSMLSFNGQNARQNNITIDGVDNYDVNSGSVRATYSQEAVKEFQVVSNSFSAEFGRASAGIVNIVTKSGTNQFHGNLFLFNRNEQISARNAFSVNKPPFSQYQFGATLGGPIKKDRAHFFTAFERLTLSDTVNVAIEQRIVDSFNRIGFPVRNGDIKFSEGVSSLLARADIRINPENQLAVRYNYAGIYNGLLEPFGTLRAETIGGIGRIRDDNLSVNHTYINSGLGLVNDLRLLFAQRDFQADPIVPQGPKVLLAAEQGSVSAGRALFLPNPREERIFQIVNNSSLVRNRQQIRFGIDYLLVYVPAGTSQLPALAAGVATFLPIDFAAITGNPALPRFSALEAFDPALRTAQQQVFLTLLGFNLPQTMPGFPSLDLTKLSLPTIFNQGFGNAFTAPRYNYLSSYFQDDITLKPNLLIKLGLRYDLERIKFTPKNNGNFSPRIAISYRPGNGDRLSLFGAYGIYHGITPFAPLAAAAVSKITDYKFQVLPFPFSIVPFSLPGHNFPESSNLPAGVNFIPQLGLTNEIQPDLRNGYTQQINAGFSYVLGGNGLVTASYQHVRGLKQFLQRDINPVVRPIRGNPIGSRVTGRIDPRLGTVLQYESTGDSYYNGLTLEFKYQLKSRLSFNASYTFAKTLDNFVDYRPELRNVQDPLNLRAERSYSNQDVRNRFVLTSIWSPQNQHILLKDFQLSTIITLESGRPYNLVTGIDDDMNGDVNPGDRPLRMSRNLGITPGFVATNIRVTRSFRFKDRYSLEGFLEAFNLFNNVSISTKDVVVQFFPPNPDGSYNLPRQENGRYILPDNLRQAAFAPRRLQFGFRVSF